MQVHGPNETVVQPYVGEYHTGAVAIYLGRYAITTYTAEDCDMLIAAACLAKERHHEVLRDQRPRVFALAERLADAELDHIAIEGTRS